jgi:hypothetical protein
MAELPLVVAVLLPGRLVQRMDLPLLHLLLHEPSPHHWFRVDHAVLCLQLLGLSGLWPLDRHHRLLDSVRLRKTDIWRYQSRLALPRRMRMSFTASVRARCRHARKPLRWHLYAAAPVLHRTATSIASRADSWIGHRGLTEVQHCRQNMGNDCIVLAAKCLHL